MNIHFEPGGDPDAALSAHGYVRLGPLLSRTQCEAIRAMWSEEKRFRSTIVMSRYRFGSGTYKYFSDPIPDAVRELRTRCYGVLAPTANAWARALGLPGDFPARHEDFLARCHSAGQTRPTPLLLRYERGDYNCLHQDIYGPVVFPLQVIVCLSDVGREYEGGELLLVEQRPRAQSIGTALPLEQGEGVAIPTRYRPAQGTRSTFRANVRHGVSEVRGGERFTLGLIFHDAE
jgi:hypothetical protein